MSRNQMFKLAMLAVAGATMSANAQQVLFDAGPHCTVRFDASGSCTFAVNQLGLSSGNISAAQPERWIATPFTLSQNSTLNEIRVRGFVPAGFEFSTMDFKIWSRSGIAAPTAANLLHSGSVPTPTPIEDPINAGAGPVYWIMTLGTPINLNAGDYYLTVHGGTPIGTNSNFAWFCNAQLDSELCPPNTPITMFNGTQFYTWRSANFTAGGFLTYSPNNCTINTDLAPGWGPDPQNPNYLFNVAFSLHGTAGVAPTGACCQSDGSCSVLTAAACCTAGGTYQGNGSACGSCPQPGACCLEDGSCVSVVQTVCLNQGGVFRGPGKPCGLSSACISFGFNEGANDAGDLPATAAQINGLGQALSIIRGEIQLGEVDMYKFQICNEGAFGATTIGTGTPVDTILCLFDSTGRGVVLSDDSPGVGQFSTLTSQFVTTNGTYYLAMSSFFNDVPPGTNNFPNLPSSAGGLIWNTFTVSPSVEVAPDGPGAATAVTSWGSPTHSALGQYSIKMTGSCFLGCYANCDGSTGNPLLTANDFQCFLDSYAGGANGTGYANCDNSQGNPALTANDFQCFLNKFAAGCN